MSLRLVESSLQIQAHLIRLKIQQVPMLQVMPDKSYIYWLHKLKFTTNKGPNLQAVTEALFDNCEDYQSIHNMKNAPIWRPY